MIRITRMRYGLPVCDTDVIGFLNDTVVLRFYTDFYQMYGEIIVNHIMP